MAWLRELKRTDKATGRKSRYYVIGWRDAAGKVRERALGFLSAREANVRLKVFEGKLAAGELLVPENAVDVPAPSPTSSPPAGTRPATRTLGEYLETTYLPRVKRDYAPGTFRGLLDHAKSVRRRLDATPLDAITFAVLDDYVLDRSEEVRSRTVQLELALIRRALKHAEKRGEIPSVPTFPTVRLTDAKPHRFLTMVESQAILGALDPHRAQPHDVTRGAPPEQRDKWSWLAILMALNTGMRSGEVLTRRWTDVRWDEKPHGTIVVAEQAAEGWKPKTVQSRRVIPLTPALREALDEARGWSRSPWIFPQVNRPDRPRNSFTKALANACERAGVARIHPHGLRHSWASRLAQAGVDRRTLMELGGWKSSSMLDEVYSHVSDDHKAEVMSRMGIKAEKPAEPEEDEDLLNDDEEGGEDDDDQWAR